MINQFIDTILGIVVVYNNNLKDSDTLKSINNQLPPTVVLDIIVYDNSEIAQDIHVFDRINIVEYIHNSSNVGVSAAYNRGADYATRLGKEWILLLDQDTLFQKNLLTQFFKAVESEKDINLFSPIIKLQNNTIFSPFKRILKKGKTLKEITQNRYPLKYFSPVNSGMLIRVKSFEKVGGYNAKVRLDFSDLQFTEKFSTKNEFFFVIDSVAIQNFSNAETDVLKLNTRFELFCEGALNCTKNNMLDVFEYLLVVLIRATSLFLRTKKIIFYKTFCSHYLFK